MARRSNGRARRNLSQLRGECHALFPRTCAQEALTPAPAARPAHGAQRGAGRRGGREPTAVPQLSVSHAARAARGVNPHAGTGVRLLRTVSAYSLADLGAVLGEVGGERLPRTLEVRLNGSCPRIKLCRQRRHVVALLAERFVVAMLLLLLARQLRAGMAERGNN